MGPSLDVVDVELVVLGDRIIVLPDFLILIHQHPPPLVVLRIALRNSLFFGDVLVGLVLEALIVLAKVITYGVGLGNPRI